MFLRSLASGLLLSTALCAAQTTIFAPDNQSAPSAPKKPVSFDLSAIDKAADPCTDFYQYACGNWNKNNPIPSDQVRWGIFNELADRNTYLLYQDLKAASDAPKTPLQTKYGSYFAACMDESLINKLGVKPIDRELSAIAALKDKKQFTALNLDLARNYAGSPLLGVAVQQDQKDSSQQILATGQGGLALPDRDYYLATDERSVKLRQQYVTHLTRMFTLLGDTADRATAEGNNVLRIETALAKGSMPRVEMRDPAKRYHIMTIAEVQALSPEYNWQQYLDGLGLNSVKTLNVSSPGFVQAAGQELATEDLPALQSYLRWHVLNTAAPFLSQPFVDENFDFFHRILNGQKDEQPRWKRCTRSTDIALGEAVGQDWVKQNFPPDAKANMEKLVSALEKALGEDIQSLPWMSTGTKDQAEAKLNAIRQKIGYPENWRDYSTLTVKRDDLLGNVDRALTFERNRNLHKLGKPVNEKEWGMTPPTVNAYYNPPQNDINFPAGILQPPFFDNSKDPAVNFGGIGVVIGHEMTHGFDDQGSKYDKNGNVNTWFTPSDLSKFKDRTECVAREYDGFQVAPGQNLNGHLTLGENTADNGGIRIAYQALMETLAAQGNDGPGYVNGERDGYTPAQRFFISFGQIWCQNATEQSARVLAKTDPHSTGEWRVKGTVENFDEFGKAFGCKVGQPMMPSNSCRVW